MSLESGAERAAVVDLREADAAVVAARLHVRVAQAGPVRDSEAVGAWSFMGMYFAAGAVWMLLTLRVWWRRRRAVPDLASDAPVLDVYELARLGRGGGRYGQCEVLIGKLLADGVLVPGEGWNDRDHNDKTWRLAVGGRLGDDAHELERAFVEAVRRKPNKGALALAGDVVDGELGTRVDARLEGLGLLYDETGRWRLWFVGVVLCLLGYGAALVQPQFCCSDQRVVDALALGAGVVMVGLMASMPETMSADVTPNGRAAVELERQRHPQIYDWVEQAGVPLAIALRGIDAVDDALERDARAHRPATGHRGIQLARELLVAESKKTI